MIRDSRRVGDIDCSQDGAREEAATGGTPQLISVKTSEPGLYVVPLNDMHQSPRVNGTNKVQQAKRLVWIAAVLFILCICGLVLTVILATNVFGTTKEEQTNSVSVYEEHYGTTTGGDDVKRFTLSNKHGMKVQVISLGGIITTLQVPDRKNNLKDVTLGYANLKGYDSSRIGKPFFGALVGRVANRIGNSQFTLDGKTYKLTANNDVNHLHGGLEGWDRAVWKSERRSDHVCLSHFSPDGDERYPGDVRVNVTIQLTDDNELIINYTARAYKKATPINLTSHPYFNLAGEGANNIYDHEVTIYADKYLPVTDILIPLGRTEDLTDNPLDLRTPVRVGDVIQNLTGDGYDNTYCLRGPDGKRLAARVSHPGTGRVMEVYTNQPSIQFYTGNFLNKLQGKNGHTYPKHSGFCLETQNYPDAVNHPSFPDSVLRPGSTYLHQVWYRFSTMP